MTEAIAFDTRRFIRRMTEAGFTERQAEALAEMYVALHKAKLAAEADKSWRSESTANPGG